MTEVDKFIDELGINLFFFGVRLHSYASADARGASQSLPGHMAAAVAEGAKFGVKVSLIARQSFIPERKNLIQSVLDVATAYAIFINKFAKNPSEHAVLANLFSEPKQLGRYLLLDSTNETQRAAGNFIRKTDAMFAYVTKALEITNDEKWLKDPLSKKISLSLLASAAYFFQLEVGKDTEKIKKFQYSNLLRTQIMVDYLRGPVIRILRNRSLQGNAIVRRVTLASDSEAQGIVDDYFRRMIRSSSPVPLILGEEDEKETDE